MITLLGKPGNPTGQIQFTAREGFRSKVKARERELIYGATCPYCANVIMAFFHTPDRIDLWPYEQTNVLTDSKKEERKGEIIKIFPTSKDPIGSSCYRSDFFQVDGDRGQQIVLKNHLMRYKAMGPRDEELSNLWEVGERSCPYTGIWNWREDIILRDLCLLFDVHPEALASYDLPPLKTLFPPVGEKLDIKYHRLAVIGNVPEVILTERDTVIRGYDFWIRGILKPYLKAAPTAVEKEQPSCP